MSSVVTSQFSDRVEFVAGVYHWDVDYVQRWDVGDLHHQLSNIGVIPVPAVAYGSKQQWTKPRVNV